MIPPGWRVGFHHSRAITQITISSSTPRLSLNEADSFRVPWNENILLTLMYLGLQQALVFY